MHTAAAGRQRPSAHDEGWAARRGPSTRGSLTQRQEGQMSRHLPRHGWALRTLPGPHRNCRSHRCEGPAAGRPWRQTPPAGGGRGSSSEGVSCGDVGTLLSRTLKSGEEGKRGERWTGGHRDAQRREAMRGGRGGRGDRGLRATGRGLDPATSPTASETTPAGVPSPRVWPPETAVASAV